MTARSAIFALVRQSAREGVFSDAANVADLDALLDRFGVPGAAVGRTGALHKVADGLAFYAGVRKVTGPLEQAQVDSIALILKAAAAHPVGWVAYELATAYHEARFKPIDEIGGDAYFTRLYDVTGKDPVRAKHMGNTEPGDGAKYHGRGFCQLTWKSGYQKAGEFLGLDLVASPDLALDPSNAARILIWGMETGAFTGKKLADYIGDRGTPNEFVQARRIVNGTDKAQLIAGHAERFQSALEAGKWT